MDILLSCCLFFAGMLLAAVLCHWRYHYELRVEIERFIQQHHERLTASEKAWGNNEDLIEGDDA